MISPRWTRRRAIRLRGRTVGMVFQEPMRALDPRMAIGAQVAEALRIHARVGRGEARARAAATLARCGLDPAEVSAGRFPHQLSGGQCQRVAIAIAIAAGPKLLIADEPTSALDAVAQARIVGLLARLVAEEGMGLLLISHDLAFVAAHADRVAVMQAGRIVETAATATLLATPAHAYSRRLLAAARHRPARAPAAPDGPPLLEVSGLSRGFGAQVAVADVGFALRRGESVGIVGASGAGKTTLLRLILGLEMPDRGTIAIAGVSLVTARRGALRAVRRQVQTVFQDPAGSFDPRWPVARIVAEPLHLLDRAPHRDERRRLVESALAGVGLPATFADRRPHALSGGERQRVAIARALILSPSLLILDEPVSALDAAARAEILDLLAELGQARSRAMLIVGHDLGVMGAITDRLFVLDRGRIVEEGPTAALLAGPRHPAALALVAAAPRILA